MAIIYSYPEIGTIATGDLMSITDVSDEQNSTKSVGMVKLSTYFTAQTLVNLTAFQLVTFDGGGLKSVDPGTVGQYLVSNGAGVYPTWQDAAWSTLTVNKIPYYDGSKFVDSIITRSGIGAKITIGDSSLIPQPTVDPTMRVYGGVYTEYVILVSPNGTKYQVTVNDTGTLITTAV